MTHDTAQRHPNGALLCGVFFLSGAAALLFETLWFRLAGLVFGNGVWASAIVLSSFMAGLALGNGLAAAHGHRVRRPIRAYALLEGVVAVTGLGLVLILPLLTGWLAPIFALFAHAPALLGVLRLSASFFLMMIPATCMGLTLPLLVKALYAENPRFGDVLGRLYGWNTLGAVAGALIGEVALIEYLGLAGTGFAAAACNLAAVAGALAVSKGTPAESTPPAQPEPAPGTAFETNPVRPPLPANARLLLVAGFLSGGILLALEVVWFRFLQLFSKSTTLTFSVMLAVVLAGIGLGGVLAAAWLRRDRAAHRFAAPLALVSGVCAATAYALFSLALSPYRDVDYYVLHWPPVLWLSVFLMLPTCLISGMLFTLMGHGLHEELRGEGQRGDQTGGETRAAGLFTMANTVGAMVGPLVAGFLLLPGPGVEWSLFGLAASYALVALCASTAWMRGAGGATPTVHTNRIAGAAALAAFALVLALFPLGRMDHYLDMASQKFRQYGLHTVAVREGQLETIQYLQKDWMGRPLHHQLVTNGFSMSGTGQTAKRYMNLYLYWPLAVNPEMKSALLICFGVGNTAKAMTTEPSLERIDVVDISRDVLDMSRVPFPHAQDNPLNDPRVTVHVEDGRFFLQTTRKTFDLITAEPPPLKAPGCVNLYTREYFQLIKDRLAPGGICTYWLPVHQIRYDEARAIMRAFSDVFDDCSLWSGKSLDWMLVGRQAPEDGAPRQAASAEAYARQWLQPTPGSELLNLGYENPVQLGSLFMMDGAQMRDMVHNVPPLTDNFPKRLGDDPDVTGEDLAAFRALEDSRACAGRYVQSNYPPTVIPPEFLHGALDYFPYQDVINRWQLEGTGSVHFPQLHAVLANTKLRILPLWLAGTDAARLNIVAELIQAGAPETPQMLLQLGIRDLALRDYAGAANYLDRARALQGGPAPTAVFLRMFALCMAGRIDEAKAVAQASAADFQTAPQEAQQYLTWLGEAFGVTP